MYFFSTFCCLRKTFYFAALPSFACCFFWLFRCLCLPLPLSYSRIRVKLQFFSQIRLPAFSTFSPIHGSLTIAKLHNLPSKRPAIQAANQLNTLVLVALQHFNYNELLTSFFKKSHVLPASTSLTFLAYRHSSCLRDFAILLTHHRAQHQHQHPFSAQLVVTAAVC